MAKENNKKDKRAAQNARTTRNINKRRERHAKAHPNDVSGIREVKSTVKTWNSETNRMERRKFKTHVTGSLDRARPRR